MTYILGSKSLRELGGVHPTLVAVVKRAIEITSQDFTVYDGLRSAAEQALAVKRGVSKTRDSFHLRQETGYGHAVDLVPIIGGLPKWDWDGCYRVALAMDKAATECGVAHLITWGGVWDTTLADLGGSESAYRLAVEQYAHRHPGPDFLDGPHFQLKR